MQAFLYFSLLAVSLTALIWASGLFVDAAEKIGRAWGISPFIIGVTIVAFGTSLPELASSISAVLLDESSLVVGNVIGSNITNLLLVLGIVAIFAKEIKLDSRVMNLDIPLLASSALLLYFALSDQEFSLHEAGIFLVALVVFIINTIRAEEIPSAEKRPKLGWKVYTSMIIAGVLIYFGASFTVKAIQELSSIFNIESEFFALTLIALGTSLPEVSVSIAAVRRKNAAIAIGNVLGSNVFNTYAVMGIPAFFGKLEIPMSIQTFSLPFMVGITLVFTIICISNKISRWEGAMLILFYGFFLAELTRTVVT